MKFSVLMSVYHKEKVENLIPALESVLVNQTFKSDDIVLVIDGPIGNELKDTICSYESQFSSLRSVQLEKNLGLGSALEIGLNECKHDLVARMDTDDICVPVRFERQIGFFKKNPEYDVIGSNIEEFRESPGDLKQFKKSAENHEELVKGIKLRSPFNHPSIMFKKSTFLKVGSYNGNLILFEDYALFIRLWLAGAKFYNLQEVLLHFRIGSGIDMIKRRSGLHYLKKEWAFLKYVRKIGAFSKFDIFKYIVIKFPIRLLPTRVVLFIYNTFLRKNKV